MKYCPTCEARFEEDIMRFCTKDGTPLINEEQPAFVEMPSESVTVDAEDDPDEVTIVRSGLSVPPLPALDDDESFEPDERPKERIVVPTIPETRRDPVRTRTAAAYYPPPRQNTFKVVVLTVFGTLTVLAMGAGLFWLFQNGQPANNNVNFNLNANANQNVNLGIDTNFNFNLNSTIGGGTNLNTNFNANVRTPTPSPSASPSPSPTLSPTATPTPRVSPTPTPSPVDEQFIPVRPTPTIDGRPRVSPTRTPTTERPTPSGPLPPVNRPN
jgi:hypothetical protein